MIRPRLLLAGLVLAQLASGSLSRAAAPPAALRIPISFEENAGQAASDVRFRARGDGFAIGLDDGGATLAVRRGDDTPAILTLRFAGAHTTGVEGLEVLPGVSHYYLGDDPARWVENARHYERVRYRAVWPGVDVVFYARERTLEYDFVVAPGADPAAIGLDVEGADDLSVDAAGDLVMTVAGREIRLRAPVAYQGDGAARIPVASAYRLASARGVRLEVGAFDRGRTLVIDPVLTYVTYLGGTLGDRIGDVAVDAGGNAWVTGYTLSAGFPTTAGGSLSGGSDVFVARLNAAGSALIFSTFLGGSATENDGRIALDAAGNVYVSGVTASTNFPVLNAAQPASGGSLDFTMSKLSPAGTLVYSTYVGGSSIELFADGMEIDADGAAYLCGQTVSTNYPTTLGAWDRTCGVNGTCGGGFDGVVTKLAPAGDAFVYSTYVGGSGNDFTVDLAVDAAGSAHVVGMTRSADLATTFGALQEAYGGDSGDPSFDGGDAFLVKLAPDGHAAVYATYLGGSDDDGAFGVAVDRGGSAYVVGATTSTDFPVTAGAFQTAFAGGRGGGSFGIPGQFVGGDGFVAKLAPDGGAITWATYVGGSGNDKLNRIVLLGTSAYVSGEVRSNDLPLVHPVQPAYGGGDFDAYAFRLSSDAGALLSATYLGGSDDTLAAGPEIAAGIAVDADGAAYVSGGTSASDFPTTAGALQETFGGASGALGDGWLAKLAMGSNPAGAAADHYLCYKAAAEPKFTPVASAVHSDAVESSAFFEVTKRKLLCTPVDRGAQGVMFPDVALVDYLIRRADFSGKHQPRLNLEVTDQLGTFRYDTRKQSRVRVPSSLAAAGPLPVPDPDAHGADLHTCYDVKASKGAARLAKGASIDVVDAFGDPVTLLVQKPTRLCAAASRQGAPIHRPTGHLMCYRVKRAAGKHVRQEGLHAANQLEALGGTAPVLATQKEDELCLPAVLGPVPPPICGDDAVNQATEQCDGDDDLACPGVLCQSDCTCAPAGLCGNGLAEPPLEQCDGVDDGACPGGCTSACFCLGPRTFTIDPAGSEARTSLGINVALAGSVEFDFHQEVESGALVFDVPVTQLPPVSLGGLGTICPFLDQGPGLPPGIAGRGVLNCSAADLAGSGFLASPTLANFQDHCVEGAAGPCDSAPNPGGGVLHATSGVFVPDGAVDATCTAPGNTPDVLASGNHAGACNGAAALTVGPGAYSAGDATLALTLILDQRGANDPCLPPANGDAVTVSFTTGNERGGIMDRDATPGNVIAYDLTGAPFDCAAFLTTGDPTGAALVGVFPAIDASLLGGLITVDLLTSIRFAGTAP